MTSAALLIKLSANPIRIEAKDFMLQGAIIMPSTLNDPLEIAAPKFLGE